MPNSDLEVKVIIPLIHYRVQLTEYYTRDDKDNI